LHPGGQAILPCELIALRRQKLPVTSVVFDTVH
jgi:hypothetical protein